MRNKIVVFFLFALCACNCLKGQQIPLGQQDIQLRPLLNPGLIEVEGKGAGGIAEATYRCNPVIKDGPATFYAQGNYYNKKRRVIWCAGLQAIRFDTDPIFSTQATLRGAIGRKLVREDCFLTIGFSAGWHQYAVKGLEQLRPLFPQDPALFSSNRNVSSLALGTGLFLHLPAKWLQRKKSGHGALNIGFSMPQIGLKGEKIRNDNKRLEPISHYSAQLNFVADLGSTFFADQTLLDGLFIAKYVKNSPVAYESLLRLRLMKSEKGSYVEYLRFGLGLSPSRLVQFEAGFPLLKNSDGTQSRIFALLSYAYSTEDHARFFSNTLGLHLFFRW